jgi:hemerythrin-like domain-containing protein
MRVEDAAAARSPVAAWHAEHAYFKRLLELLQREIDVFHGAERANYELMLDVISYLRDYGDRVHHPREDAAFARLEARCPDMARSLARLGQEHRVIAHAGESLAKLLQAALGGALVPRAEIEVAAATYLVYFGNHIAKEDEDVLPRAAKALDAADWRAVAAAVPAAADPLFSERYRELRREIALEARPAP